MTTLTIYRGLAGSGKSTHALSNMRPHYVIIERDQIRNTSPRNENEEVFQYENKVTKVQHKLIKMMLENGVSVMASDTNLRDKYVRPLLKLAHEAGAEVRWEDFRGVPLEKALIQNSKRVDKEPIPEQYIRDTYNKYIKGRDLSVQPTYDPTSEKPHKVVPYIQPPTPYLNQAVIFDIDNTLAIMGDRSPYDGTLVHIDTVNKEVRGALELYYSAGVRVLIVSGRSAEYREVTEQWFKQHGIPYDALYMRPAGDSREDSIIKSELFDEHIRPHNYYIAGVFDDRHRVLRMWRQLELTTFHVNGPDAGLF